MSKWSMEKDNRPLLGKRLLDVFFSLLGLVLTSPLLLIINFLIKKEDGGSVFYRGLRVGRNGRLFKIYKFRSMVINADKIGGPSTSSDDSRITKIGTFIRKYKLDELPQLINVLKGDMSFVGPRPEVKQYVDMYSESEKVILTVRPGITDWASLWNIDEGSVLAGSPDPEKAYLEKIRPTKLKLQLKYVREQSFFTDIKIIGLTLYSIITRKRVLVDI